MLSRRAVILSAPAIIVARSANAEMVCGPFDWQGLQVCEVGVSLGRVTTAQQQCPNWCWAACLQTIFQIHGYEVDQARIVERVYPDRGCYTASGFQIANGLSGRWNANDGEAFRAYVEPIVDLSVGFWTPGVGAIVADELRQDNPLINGALGHATVITAMSYIRNQWGQGQPVQIIVRDPMPGNPNRRLLSPAESVNTFFVARVRFS